MKEDSKLDRILEQEFAEDVMDLKGKLSKLGKVASPKSKKGNLRLILPALAVAASIALAIFFLPSLSQNGDANSIYASYYEPYPMALNQRGDGSQELNSAIQSYSNGDFESALANFKALYDSNGETVHLLYAANSEQGMGRYESAIELYDQIIATNDRKLTEQAQWYKILALIKLNRLEEAKQWIKRMPSSHYKYAEANEILRKIK